MTPDTPVLFVTVIATPCSNKGSLRMSVVSIILTPPSGMFAKEKPSIPHLPGAALWYTPNILSCDFNDASLRGGRKGKAP